MSSKTENKTYIYIDANNLYQGIRYYFDWRLDYKKFYIFLQERYKPQDIYLFIGYIEQNKALYKHLTSVGYKLIFKEITKDAQGNIKGNCDADMVLQIVKDYYENKIQGINTKAVLVTADGDFASTIKFLKDKNAFEIVLAPCPPLKTLSNGRIVKPLSFLIRNLNIRIEYISRYKKILGRI